MADFGHIRTGAVDQAPHSKCGGRKPLGVRVPPPPLLRCNDLGPATLLGDGAFVVAGVPPFHCPPTRIHLNFEPSGDRCRLDPTRGAPALGVDSRCSESSLVLPFTKRLR